MPKLTRKQRLGLVYALLIFVSYLFVSLFTGMINHDYGKAFVAAALFYAGFSLFCVLLLGAVKLIDWANGEGEDKERTAQIEEAKKTDG